MPSQQLAAAEIRFLHHGDLLFWANLSISHLADTPDPSGFVVVWILECAFRSVRFSSVFRLCFEAIGANS